jgi:cytochrome c oxidase assembly factor CtaG
MRPNRAREAAFLAGGLAVLVVALLPPFDAVADRRLTVHMVQHLLIVFVAAPLIVAGAPVRLALRTLPRDGRDALVRLLHSRFARTLGHPVVAWSVFAAVMLGTHVPAFYDLALRVPAVHAGEHALYLWAALVFWAPLIAVDPVAHRLSSIGAVLYMLTAMVPMTLVGVWLLTAESVVYPHYAAYGNALADQHSGGVVMWLAGGLLLIAATLICVWAAMLREERHARAREAYQR